MTKRKNYFYLNKRNKKNPNCTEMNSSNQAKKKLDWFFVSLLFEKRSKANPLKHEFQFHWSTKSCISGLGPYWPHFQLKVRASVTSSRSCLVKQVTRGHNIVTSGQGHPTPIAIPTPPPHTQSHTVTHSNTFRNTCFPTFQLVQTDQRTDGQSRW